MRCKLAKRLADYPPGWATTTPRWLVQVSDWADAGRVDAQPLILLPLDQLASGENKIPVAIEYARMMGARLVLLHVLPPRELDPQTVLPSEASTRVYLDTVAAQIERAGVPAAKVVRRGSPGRVIVDEATRIGARLIILGSNLHSRLSTALGASVAEQVSRHGAVSRAHGPAECADRTRRTRWPTQLRRGRRARRALVRHHRGVRPIEIARIVGSVCRARELGPDFQRPGPLKPGSIEEQRFRRVLNATQEGVSLPPISVFQIGFGYYVEDGHHRVAAARICGQTEIDADVTEFVSEHDEQTTALAATRQELRAGNRPARAGRDTPRELCDVAARNRALRARTRTRGAAARSAAVRAGGLPAAVGRSSASVS